MPTTPLPTVLTAAACNQSAELPSLSGPAGSPWPEGLPCVIDVEASGFGRGSYPIEVGFVLPSGETFCTLVRPPPHWTHWDPQAELLHGISRELLQRHGRPPRAVAEILNQRLRGSTLYCDGWAHDYSWLAKLFEEADMQASFKLRQLQELLNESDQARFDAACGQVRIDLASARHRASNDAKVLQQAYRRIRTLHA